MKYFQSPIIKKGFNVYQVRIYDVFGELIDSQITYEQKHASTYFCNAISDEQTGSTISHTIIRCFNLVLGDWIFCELILNPKSEKEVSNVQKRWKISLFDISDTMVYSEESEQPFADEYIQSTMELNKALYTVFSGIDCDKEEDRFYFTDLVTNEKFNFSLFDEASGKNRLSRKDKFLRQRCILILMHIERSRYLAQKND